MKVLLTLFIITCLVGTARAGLSTTFTFDDGTLAGGENSGAISDYMTAVYGSTVTVEGATVYPSSTLNPLSVLGGDNYIADAVPGPHQFTIEFAVPITAVSFNWARADDPFKLDVTFADGTIGQIFSTQVGQWGGATSGSWAIDLLPKPVSILFFHDGGQGAIGIDDLAVVSAVPLPASILLGVFAVGLAARKLRQFV